MIHILVTGANGQVGQELQRHSSDYPEIKFEFASRENLDISNQNNVSQYIDKCKPDFVINAAAYTAVDKAEEDQENAYLVNAQAPLYLAKACKNIDAWLLHISSDYVYHHNPKRPLKENDETLAQGIYAKSKLEGDNNVIISGCKYSILRTSWVYSSFGNNFVKTMIRLGQSKDALTIVADQVGSPTYASDIALALLHQAKTIHSNPEKSINYQSVFNFSNRGQTHWADFAREIFAITNIDCKVSHTTTESYNAPAPRPLWSVMDKSKFSEVWNMELVDWKKSLRDCIALINEMHTPSD